MVELCGYLSDVLFLRKVGLPDELHFIRLRLRQWLAWLRGYQQRGERTTMTVLPLHLPDQPLPYQGGHSTSQAPAERG